MAKNNEIENSYKIEVVKKTPQKLIFWKKNYEKIKQKEMDDTVK